MGQEQGTTLGALAKASKLSAGRPEWKERATDLIEMIFDAATGAVYPVINSKASTLGELAAAALPFVAATKGIRAYHGSPHDFDKFSTAKIGTGEGAQAYGHGLYFAGDENVAKYYKNQLSSGMFEYQGQPVDPRSGLGRTLDFLRANVMNGENISETLPKRIQELRDHANFMRRAEPGYGSDAMYDRAADTLSQLDPSQLKVGGRMYEVQINADPEHFLDWDAPLSQQHPEVSRRMLEQVAGGDYRPAQVRPGQYGVTRVFPGGHGELVDRGTIYGSTPDEAMKNFRIGLESLSGQQAWERTAALHSKAGPSRDWGTIPDPEAASAALKQAGIPGIKYLDQGSRAAGEGTRNYVVFDDAIVNILKKYGIGAAVGTGATLEAERRNRRPSRN